MWSPPKAGTSSVAHSISWFLILAASAMCAGCAADAHSTAHAGIALGTVEVDRDGAAASATNGAMVELGFETMLQAKAGGGIRARLMSSDDGLDSDPGDAVAEATRATDGDWFLHATFENAAGESRMPFRLGLSVRNFELEEAAPGDVYSFSSYGPRVEFAPVVPLIQRESLTVSATGMVGFAYGIATIEEASTGQESEANAGFMDFGVGIRAAFGKGFADFGFRHMSSTYEEGDGALGLAVGEVDATFSGVLLSMGLRF